MWDTEILRAGIAQLCGTIDNNAGHIPATFT